MIRVYKSIVFYSLKHDHSIFSASKSKVLTTITNKDASNISKNTISDGFSPFSFFSFFSKDNNNNVSSAPSDNSDVIKDELKQMIKISSLASMLAVLSGIHSRWARKPFSSSSLWEVYGDKSHASTPLSDIFTGISSSFGSNNLYNEIKGQTSFGTAVLKHMYFAVNFYDRMKLFREYVDNERYHIQHNGADSHNDYMNYYLHGPNLSKGTVVQIRRNYLLHDGLQAFEKVGSKIKDRIVIRYINDNNEEEKGIDIGGLFKDFLTDITRQIYDPNYGLFCVNKNNLLYPNPDAIYLYDKHELENLFLFLGMTYNDNGNRKRAYA